MIDKEMFEKLQEACLWDDFYMKIFFNGELDLIGHLIRTIIGKDDLTVEKAEIQKNIPNSLGRSVILDIYATDSQKDVYNIEVQKSSEGASPKRARYYSSMLDVSSLKAGEDYEKLPNTYVIFLTEDDYWGMDKELYEFVRRDVENEVNLNDGTTIIYVNGKNKNDTDLGRLIQDFSKRNIEEMTDDKLIQRAKRIKNTEDTKMGTFDDYVYSRIEKSRQEGIIDVAKQFIKLGKNSLEDIATATGLPLETVQELAKHTA